jgi:hypothetical protein
MSKSGDSEVEEYELQPVFCVAGIIIVSTLAGPY